MSPHAETLHDLLADLAAAYGDAPALADGVLLPVSFADVRRIAAGLGDALRVRGLARHDRLAIVVPQKVPGALAWLGATAAMTTLPLREDMAPAEAADLMTRAAVRAVLLPENQSVGLAAAAAAELPVVTFRWEPESRELALDGAEFGRPAPWTPPSPDDIAGLLSTSGTTGKPRLAIRRQRTVAIVPRTSHMGITLGPGHRTVLVFPIPPAAGQNELLTAMCEGAETILAGVVLPADLPALVRRFDPHWLTVSPAHVSAWARERTLQATGHPTRLLWIGCGGAALDDTLRTSLEEHLGVPVLNLYGSSEAGMVSFNQFPPASLTGDAGRPVIPVRVVDALGRELPPGSPGILHVSGPTVFPGYLDDPEATARAFAPDGWFITGDRAILHPDGSLSLLGRSDDLINRGGDKVDPAEVEAVLNAHPAVLESAVFAITHPGLGHEPAAVLVLRPGQDLSLRDVRRWLIARLSPHKIPRRIAFVPELPRTPTGKVRRAALPTFLDNAPGA